MNSGDFTLSMLVMVVSAGGEPIRRRKITMAIQLENGVGMLRLLEDEVAEELSKREGTTVTAM